MVEGYVTDAFETSAGTVWYQARNSDGDLYHVKQGSGQQSQQSYAAAKGHNLTNSISDREADASELVGRMEMIDTRSPGTSGIEQGTVDYELSRDKGKMLGYIYAKYDEIETNEDWEEALDDYANFVDDLSDADSVEEREDIREAYGVGGS